MLGKSNAAAARPVRDQPPGLWHGEGTVTVVKGGDKYAGRRLSGADAWPQAYAVARSWRSPL